MTLIGLGLIGVCIASIDACLDRLVDRLADWVAGGIDLEFVEERR